MPKWAANVPWQVCLRTYLCKPCVNRTDKNLSTKLLHDMLVEETLVLMCTFICCQGGVRGSSEQLTVLRLLQHVLRLLCSDVYWRRVCVQVRPGTMPHLWGPLPGC